MLDEVNVEAWVARAVGVRRSFREAVHIVLNAISASTALSSQMIMKGGMLMAIRYDSTRFTRDADFSTRNCFNDAARDALLAELDTQLVLANDRLGYDTLCRRQSGELRPAKAGSTHPTLCLRLGYARRSRPSELQRLHAGRSTHIVEVDYSYNEAVCDIEVLNLGDGQQLSVYSYVNLIAEKYRSLLQQPIRSRSRQQDVYDLDLLVGIGQATPSTATERHRILDVLVASCREHDITPLPDSIRCRDVRTLAEQGYRNLQSDIEGELPPFDQAFARVCEFYEGLPWAVGSRSNE